MKLGLITDIHEHNENLRRVLERFEREQVDQIVFIGDLLELGRRIEETCRLMSGANVVGVWGNHDFGLCFDVDEDVKKRYPSAVLNYTATLRPRLVVEDCHFSHVEPWLNPEEIADLWFFGPPPDTPERLEQIFQAVPQRLMFSGHNHRWLLITPEGIQDWQGDQSIPLAEGRYFVVINALCNGYFAIFDTESSLLTPYRVE